MDPGVVVPEGYNILRHAGAIYAMDQHEQMQPDRAMRSAMVRAARYLRDETIGPLPHDGSILAVWSKPQVVREGKPLQAKLGGAGLALVALVSVERIRPGFTPVENLRGMGRFILYMQKPDGSFYTSYRPGSVGRDDSWTSAYYPGEAAFGLVMLYEKDPSEGWIRAAVRALEQLALAQVDSDEVPADHWALIATEKLLALEGVELAPDTRERLVRHAVQVCETILRSQITDPDRGPLYGGFAANGNVTPTSTRLEGLLAARAFLPPDDEIVGRIDAAVDLGIDFLLRAQVRESWHAGAFPRSISKITLGTLEKEGFNERVTEVRVDYVQHALSALVRYLESREGRERPGD
jgi:hypothetical protein